MGEFTAVIIALRCDERPRFRWVYPLPEETETADVLAEIDAHHQTAPDGSCRCGGGSPCPARLYGREIALQALARGSDRYIQHARAVLAHLPLPEETR